MLPSWSKLKTIIGIPFSMQSEAAVESMTPSFPADYVNK